MVYIICVPVCMYASYVCLYVIVIQNTSIVVVLYTCHTTRTLAIGAEYAVGFSIMNNRSLEQ